MGNVTIQKAYEPKPVPVMSGWKTKYGSIILITGTALLGAADVAPSMQIGEWMSFIGKIATGIGGGLTAYGIGHKLEKNKPTVVIESKKVNLPSSPTGNAGVIR